MGNSDITFLSWLGRVNVHILSMCQLLAFSQMISGWIIFVTSSWSIFSEIRKVLSKVAKEKDCELLNEWIKPCENHLHWSATSTFSGNGLVIWANSNHFWDTLWIHILITMIHCSTSVAMAVRFQLESGSQKVYTNYGYCTSISSVLFACYKTTA
jgi:REP element-mobilizing transposase RayT